MKTHDLMAYIQSDIAGYFYTKKNNVEIKFNGKHWTINHIGKKPLIFGIKRIFTATNIHDFDRNFLKAELYNTVCTMAMYHDMRTKESIETIGLERFNIAKSQLKQFEVQLKQAISGKTNLKLVEGGK